MIVEGFHGPGGWGLAIKRLGLPAIGLEWDPHACATAVKARLAVMCCDVAAYPTAHFAGLITGKVDSPPCGPFAKSGQHLGLIDQPLVHQAVEDLSRGKDTRDQLAAGCLDQRSILAAEPMRWHHDLRPEWIAMEQVPAVLPLWEQYAQILTAWGYSAACGVLDAADYGLGQNRKRAILIANRTADVALPAPTHGPGLAPHVSMANILEWGYTQRPAPTVTGGGVATGGAEPFGNGTRQAMHRAIGTTDAKGRPLWRDRNVPLRQPTAKETAAGKEPKPNLRPTLRECALLQGFPADYPFQGNAGQRFLQAGNAVPPPLATAVITAATGITARQQLLAAA